MGWIMLALWALYMSIVNVGQLWYGYGWEIQLLETGFLAVFLCPLLDGGGLSPRVAPPVVVVWLYSLAHLPNHARRGTDQAATETNAGGI
jgi:hypothetical protein